MKRYIKPLCEVTKIAVENHLLAGSLNANNEEGAKENDVTPWYAPNRRTTLDEGEEEY